MIRCVLPVLATLFVSAGMSLACETAFTYGDREFSEGARYSNEADDKFERALDIYDTNRDKGCELLDESRRAFERASDAFWAAARDYSDAVEDCSLDGDRENTSAARDNRKMSREYSKILKESAENAERLFVKYCAG